MHTVGEGIGKVNNDVESAPAVKHILTQVSALQLVLENAAGLIFLRVKHKDVCRCIS